MDEKERIIQAYEKLSERNDLINRRLVTCVIAVVGLLCAMCAFVAFTYFTADYYYPNITTENSTNTTNTIGGER